MDLDVHSFEPLLKSLAVAGLPYLGTAVGAMLTPVMGPFGMLVSPGINLAVSEITKALGIPDTSTPQQIADTVAADPEGAKAKLASLEEQHRFELAQQKQADDRTVTTQAQQTSVNLVEAQSESRVARWARPAMLWGFGALVLASFTLPYGVWFLRCFGVDVPQPPAVDPPGHRDPVGATRHHGGIRVGRQSVGQARGSVTCCAPSSRSRFGC